MTIHSIQKLPPNREKEGGVGWGGGGLVVRRMSQNSKKQQILLWLSSFCFSIYTLLDLKIDEVVLGFF